MRVLPALLRSAPLLLLLSGCAAGRAFVEITPPVAVNPGGGALATIVSVEDRRRFEAKPGAPSTPSLQNASEIDNPAITARALARKRGAYGGAFGDILLPSGQSVAGLVRAAARKALADKGYVVVEPDSPNVAAATPLSIDIMQFWSWFTPGFASVRIEFNATVNMRGAGLLERDPSTVTSQTTHEGIAIFESDWKNLVQHGVEDLSVRIEQQVRPAPRSR